MHTHKIAVHYNNLAFTTQSHIFTSMYDWLCHFATLNHKGGQVTMPIIRTCENMYAIDYCKSYKYF